MNLKWYVLNYNFNKKRINYFNIFQYDYFTQSVKELLKQKLNKKDFIAQLEQKLMYCFWSKREFELFVGDAFETDIEKYKKIDVYSQIKPNIEILAEYIINNFDID